MDEEATAKILPFVPVDLGHRNHQIDVELQDKERSQALVDMANEALADLDVQRLIDGSVA